MHHLPRFIIAIPIAVMVLVVYIKMAFPNQFRMLASSRSGNQIASVDTSEYSRQEAVPAPQKTDPVSFDIVKPRTCEYKNEGLIAKVYIQKSKVSATITQEDGIKNIMLLNDCVHIWKQGEFSGQQICGVSQYLGLFQMYSSFLSPDSIMSMVPGLGGGDTLSSVLSSCVDGAVDESEFILPNGITFKESSPEQAKESIDK